APVVHHCAPGRRNRPLDAARPTGNRADEKQTWLPIGELVYGDPVFRYQSEVVGPARPQSLPPDEDRPERINEAMILGEHRAEAIYIVIVDPRDEPTDHIDASHGIPPRWVPPSYTLEAPAGGLVETYSSRNTPAGSTRVARIAGIRLAASATGVSRLATSTKVVGSVAWTSYSWLAMTRVSTSAATSPSATPANASRI